MKKYLLSLCAGMLSLSAMVAPTFAAEQTRDVNVGYDSSMIPDPDNPENPTWSVSVPKSFKFTDSYTSNEMKVTLNTISNGGLDVTKTAPISVKSANSFKLIGGAGGGIDYSLTYGGTAATGAEYNNIGSLQNVDGKRELVGTAALTDKTQLASADGSYTDVLTYRVSTPTGQ